jgi:hypothetical protein
VKEPRQAKSKATKTLGVSFLPNFEDTIETDKIANENEDLLDKSA